MVSTRQRIINKKTSKGCTALDIYIGKALWKSRRDLRVTQGEVAKVAGITFQQIQKYEKGINRITVGRLYEISKYLKIDIGALFAGFAKYIPTEPNDNYDSFLSNADIDVDADKERPIAA